MTRKSYRIAISVDEVLTTCEATTPSIMVKLLVFWELVVLGLGTLETSTLLPVPLYGCWSAITNPQLAGTNLCEGSPMFGSGREPIRSMLSACGAYSWWQPMAWAGSLLTVGRMLMCISAGIGCDLFGRRRSAIVWSAAFCVFAFIRSFAPIMEVYVMCVTMEAICSQAATLSLILIVFEGCTGKECVRMVCLSLLGHAIAVSVLIPVIHINIQHDIYRQLARSIPAVIFVFLVMGLPESFRWVLSQGKLDNVESTLRASHGLTLDEFAKAKLFQINTQIRKERASSGCAGNVLKQSVFPLFVKSVFCRVTFPLLLICLMVGSAIGFRLLYDPLPYHSIEDRLITSGVAEILALQFIGLLCTRVSIKRVAAGLALLLAVVLIATRILLYYNIESCIGNMILSGGGHLVCILLWVWIVLAALRLIPTHSRGCLLSMCLGCAVLGHSFAKSIYESFWRDLEWGVFYPVFVFSGMTVVAGVLCLILPDTPKVVPDMLCHVLPQPTAACLIETAPEEPTVENTEL